MNNQLTLEQQEEVKTWEEYRNRHLETVKEKIKEQLKKGLKSL